MPRKPQADGSPPNSDLEREPTPDLALNENGSVPPGLDNFTPSASTPFENPTEPSTPIPYPGPSTLKRKRGRPSRAALEERRLSTPLRDEDGFSVASDVGTPSNTTNHPSAAPSTRGKRRGRPPAPGSKAARNRGGPSHYTQVPLDKDGNPQTVENDEIVLEPDPAGETKVNSDGELLGGREYRCRVFTILGRGNRLYMLSTEPARCIGFRDSYLFFQKHKQLFKIIMSEDEKYDMIERDIIPHSYKGRAIGVVTARSVFREFGARIVVGGKKIIDDYWETKERLAGAVEGQLADPEDRLPPPGEEYNRKQYVAWHGASSVYHTGQPSVPVQSGLPKRRKVHVTEANWMYEHAKAASIFNSRLYRDRQPNKNGVYEAHTNQWVFPAATQPTVVKWTQVEDSPRGAKQPKLHDKVIFDECQEMQPFVGNGLGVGIDDELKTGYGDWDDSVIDALETEEERQAVRAQVALEREWRARWG